MGLSNAGAPTVSEPNLKLRYKPKKSLEQRKNPLLRKESAPPSLRRRPAETLGGEDQQRGRGWLISSLWARSHRGRGPLLRAIMGSWLYSICPTLLQGGRLGLKANPCSLCPEEGVPLKKKSPKTLETNGGLLFFLSFWEESGKQRPPFWLPPGL